MKRVLRQAASFAHRTRAGVLAAGHLSLVKMCTHLCKTDWLIDKLLTKLSTIAGELLTIRLKVD